MTLPSRGRLLTLAVVLAGLLPGQTMANDRDLRATTVPTALCTGAPEGHFDNGFGLLVGMIAPPGDANVITARCALPLNNVDLGGTSNDNDMSSFTVFYKDADGLGAHAGVFVVLYEVRLSGGICVRSQCALGYLTATVRARPPSQVTMFLALSTWPRPRFTTLS